MNGQGSIGEKRIDTIDIFVTEQCNMDCAYCYHQKRDATMNVEKGKGILRRLYEVAPECRTFVFFGGEPLLYPKTVLELAAYARKIWRCRADGKKEFPRFCLVTNGSYFNRSVFLQMKRLGFSLQVSCDGDGAANIQR